MEEMIYLTASFITIIQFIDAWLIKGVSFDKKTSFFVRFPFFMTQLMVSIINLFSTKTKLNQ